MFRLIAPAAVLLSVLLATPANSAAPTIPLDHFLQHSDYLDAKLSPDGQHLATRLRENERIYLSVISLKDNKPVGGVNPRINNEVTRYQWVNNERLVYSLAEKRAGRDKPIDSDEIYGINIDGRQARILAGFRASDERGNTRISNRSDSNASFEVISNLKGDPKNVLIAEYRWEREGNYYYKTGKTRPIVSKMSVINGRKRKVETIDVPGADLHANAVGEINFLTYTDEDYYSRTMYRKDADSQWQPIDDVFDVGSDGIYVRSVNDAGDKMYFEKGQGSQRIGSIYELDVATGTVRTVFNNASADIENWISNSSNEVVIGMSYPAKTAYFYDEQSDSNIIRLHKMLRQAFGGQHVSIESMDTKGELAIVNVQSDTNPGEFYLFNTKTKEAQFLFANYSWLDPASMQPKRPIQFEARDGVVINGYLTLPEGADKNTKAPLIVLPHGGPHSVRDYPFFDWEAQLLANRGYAVLQPNFRGSAGYGGAFRRLGYREWGGNMINDIVDATRHVIDEQPIDATNVCIFGHSYGAYAAIMASIKVPELYKCTIGSAGLYDLVRIKQESLISMFQGGSAYLDRAIGTDVEELKANSPSYQAAKLESKVLLVHGTNDSVTTKEHFDSLTSALADADKPFESLVIQDSGHGPYNLKNRQAQYTKILEFLENNLTTQP